MLLHSRRATCGAIYRCNITISSSRWKQKKRSPKKLQQPRCRPALHDRKQLNRPSLMLCRRARSTPPTLRGRRTSHGWSWRWLLSMTCRSSLSRTSVFGDCCLSWIIVKYRYLYRLSGLGWRNYRVICIGGHHAIGLSLTRSSSVAERAHDALCDWIFC